jgi:hypothetical protein
MPLLCKPTREFRRIGCKAGLSLYMVCLNPGSTVVAYNVIRYHCPHIKMRSNL